MNTSVAIKSVSHLVGLTLCPYVKSVSHSTSKYIDSVHLGHGLMQQVECVDDRHVSVLPWRGWTYHLTRFPICGQLEKHKHLSTCSPLCYLIGGQWLQGKERNVLFSDALKMELCGRSSYNSVSGIVHIKGPLLLFSSRCAVSWWACLNFSGC